MFRDTEEELARLEAELLAEEDPAPEEAEDTYEEDYEEEYDDYEDGYDPYDADEDDADETDPLEEYYGVEKPEADYPVYTAGYHAYNTDQTDEDLMAYAEAVRTPKRSGCFTVLVVILCLLSIGALGLLLLILRQWGYL